jgi:hypothetical protein
MELKNDEKSMDFALRSLKMNEKLFGQSRIIYNQLNNIGMLYCNSGKHEEAIKFL